jgi:hypothetical protein
MNKSIAGIKFPAILYCEAKYEMFSNLLFELIFKLGDTGKIRLVVPLTNSLNTVL